MKASTGILLFFKVVKIGIKNTLVASFVLWVLGSVTLSGQPKQINFARNFQPAANGKFEKVLLSADYYTGRTDLTTPIVILIHGGHFLAPGENELPWGDVKDSCITYLARELQEVGLHVLVPTLRTGLESWLTPKEAYIRALYRASQDIHTLIRYINSRPKDLFNQSIDTTKIILWGFESGGLVAAACSNATRNQEWTVPELYKPDGSGPVINFDELGNPFGTTVGKKAKDTLHVPLYLNWSGHAAMWVGVGGAILSNTWVRFTSPINLLFHVPTDATIPFGSGKIIMPKGYEVISDAQGSKRINELYQGLTKYDLWDRARLADPISLMAKERNGGREGLFIFNTRSSTDHTPWNWADSATWIKVPHPTCAPLMPPICSYYLNALFSNPDMSGLKGRKYVDTMLSFFKPRIDVLFGTKTSVKPKLERATSAFTIFPNPVQEIIYIQSHQVGVTDYINLTLADKSGRLVSEEKRTWNKVMTLSIADHLPAGIYFLTITKGNFIETHRIMVMPKQ